MRVALLGDIHGNVRYLDWALDHAAEAGAELMIQLGDFGFDFGDGFLSALANTTDKHQIPLFAIRGNHDDPWWFRQYQRMGMVNLIHDGMMMTIGKKRVAFLGGAVSIDRNRRDENISWWKDERVNPNIVNTWSMNNETADILISHEAPIKPYGLPNFNLSPDVINDCDEDRHVVHMAAEILEPDVIYHGHYHRRYQSDLFLSTKKTLIEGLNCDGNPINQSMLIQDW